MRFSIIVPVYNTQKYIKDCVESVMAQSVRDWELILVDDGSCDGSLSIIKEYEKKDPRIKVIAKENEGQLFARRTGFSFARGDYILCLDSDDYWTPDCLFTLSKYIDEYNADLIMFPCQKVNDKGEKSDVVGRYSKEVVLVEKRALYTQVLSSYLLNSMSLKAFKRELLEDDDTNYSSFNKRSFGEDKLQTLHIITKAKTVLSIPKVLYYYRKNESNVSSSIDFDLFPSMIGNELFTILYDYMKKWDMCDALSLRKYNTYYLQNYINAVYNLRRKCKANS